MCIQMPAQQGGGSTVATRDPYRVSGHPYSKSFHIFLEMITVFLAIKKSNIARYTLIPVHSDRTDNLTVVHYLNRSGSARSEILNSWVLSIMMLLWRKHLFIKSFHKRGTPNVIANSLSRQAPLPSEWQLD